MGGSFPVWCFVKEVKDDDVAEVACERNFFGVGRRQTGSRIRNFVLIEGVARKEGAVKGREQGCVALLSPAS